MAPAFPELQAGSPDTQAGSQGTQVGFLGTPVGFPDNRVVFPHSPADSPGYIEADSPADTIAAAGFPYLAADPKPHPAAKAPLACPGTETVAATVPAFEARSFQKDAETAAVPNEVPAVEPGAPAPPHAATPSPTAQNTTEVQGSQPALSVEPFSHSPWSSS